MPRDGEVPELARVIKRLRYKDDIPILITNYNPILESQIYKVEYPDGHRLLLAANAIAEILFAKIGDEGFNSVLLQEISDHRVNAREVTKDRAFIISSNCG